jgi:hypothetical protein
MNRQQGILITILLMFVGMCLYPPITVSSAYYYPGQQPIPHNYHYYAWLWAGDGSIDAIRMILQVMVLTALSAPLIYISRASGKRNHLESNQKQNEPQMTTGEGLEKLAQELARAKRHNRRLLIGLVLCVGASVAMLALNIKYMRQLESQTTSTMSRVSNLELKVDGLETLVVEDYKSGARSLQVKH